MKRRSAAASSLCGVILSMIASMATAEPSIVPVQQQPANVPMQRPEGSVNRRHASFNERARQGNIDLVFFGDSITHGWEDTGKAIWDQYYAKRRAANFGISGDRTQHVLWRIENGNLDGIAPKAVVIMIGTNNLNDNPEPEIIEGITKIVQDVRAKSPSSRILLLGIFPRDEHADSPLRKHVNSVNAAIAKLDDGVHVFFEDIGPRLTNSDGAMKRELTQDFTHLTEAGYRVWAESIEPCVAEWLGMPAIAP